MQYITSHVDIVPRDPQRLDHGIFRISLTHELLYVVHVQILVADVVVFGRQGVVALLVLGGHVYVHVLVDGILVDVGGRQADVRGRVRLDGTGDFLLALQGAALMTRLGFCGDHVAVGDDQAADRLGGAQFGGCAVFYGLFSVNNKQKVVNTATS